jgi:hypothetical protein
MKKIFVLSVFAVFFAGCVSTGTTKDGESSSAKGGYQGRWEQAVLSQDDFGSELRVIRENEEIWVLVAKTNCFWARQYVGRSVWLKWGPIESKIMNDEGETCDFWTRKRIQ